MYQHYERPDLIPDLPNEPDEPLRSYHELVAMYSEEQRAVVESMERVWATRLMTFHMPPFFQFIFVPILFFYFSFLAPEKRKQWASKMTNPLYVSLAMIRPIWNLGSWWLFVKLRRRSLPSTAVCQEIRIPTREVIGGGRAPPGAVRCMVYSHRPLSLDDDPVPALILHLHGGGFIASSPEAHENYLRHWTERTGCPILSVDYSLAPEFPYPTALNEAISVYEFLMSEAAASVVGTRWKKILMTGDSAGGNLTMALTLYLLECTSHRPDGLVLVYPSTNRTPTLVTPSNQLFQNDAMIPRSVRLLYSSAYTQLVWDASRQQWKDSETFHDHRPHYASPIEAPDTLLAQFPPTYFICGDHDPLWSDTQLAYNRLCALSSQPVYCDIFPQLTHGFLSLGSALPQTFEVALERTTHYFQEFAQRDGKDE